MEKSDSLTVLVVAWHDDLRRSLTFMLSAEGFVVHAKDSWPQEDNMAGFDLAVIDHGIFCKGYCGDEALSRLAEKVVILAERPRSLPFISDAVVVRKPLLDHELTDTLNSLSVRSRRTFACATSSK